MNTSPEPEPETPDPLLQSLAGEAADLPARAASAARQRIRQRRENRQRLAVAAMVSFLGVVTWIQFPPRTAPQAGMAVHATPPGHAPDAPVPAAPAPVPATPGPPDSGQAGSLATAAHDNHELPSGLDHEQIVFCQATRGLPLLFVRNASGKVTRIHVIER